MQPKTITEPRCRSRQAAPQTRKQKIAEGLSVSMITARSNWIQGKFKKSRNPEVQKKWRARLTEEPTNLWEGEKVDPCLPRSPLALPSRCPHVSSEGGVRDGVAMARDEEFSGINSERFWRRLTRMDQSDFLGINSERFWWRLIRMDQSVVIVGKRQTNRQKRSRRMAWSGSCPRRTRGSPNTRRSGVSTTPLFFVLVSCHFWVCYSHSSLPHVLILPRHYSAWSVDLRYHTTCILEHSYPGLQKLAAIDDTLMYLLSLWTKVCSSRFSLVVDASDFHFSPY